MVRWLCGGRGNRLLGALSGDSGSGSEKKPRRRKVIGQLLRIFPFSNDFRRADGVEPAFRRRRRASRSGRPATRNDLSPCPENPGNCAGFRTPERDAEGLGSGETGNSLVSVRQQRVPPDCPVAVDSPENPMGLTTNASLRWHRGFASIICFRWGPGRANGRT